MIICEPLKQLWEVDLQDSILGAVQDFVNDKTKEAVGLQSRDEYFNAGLLLINLKRWKELRIEEKCIQYINEHNGCIVHHDQGVLNGVLAKQWKRLPIENNLMTIHYFFNRRKLRKYYQDHSEFYTDKDVKEAQKKPVILHYTPSFTSRPWVKDCKHPLRCHYWKALECTPWKGAIPQKNNAKWYVKLIDWRYRNLPY